MMGKVYYAATKKTGNCLENKPCTLKQALDKAKSGDHVIVKDGVYIGKFETRADGVTIRAQNMHKAVLNGKQNSKPTLTIKHSHITVSGLTIDGAKKGRLLFVGVPGSPEISNILLENNRLIRSAGAGIQVANWGNNKPISNMVIRHNYISDMGTFRNPGEGIYLGASPEKPNRGLVKNVEIYGNTIDNFAHNGVDMKPNTENVRIHHNILKNQVYKKHHKKKGNEGTFAINGRGHSVYDNILMNNDAGKMGAFFIIPAGGHQVSGNLIDGMKSPLAFKTRSGEKWLSSEVRNNLFCDVQSTKIVTDGTSNANALLISGNVGLSGKADQAMCAERKAALLDEIESLPDGVGMWECECDTADTMTAPYGENIALEVLANRNTQLGVKSEASTDNDIELVPSPDGLLLRMRGSNSARTYSLDIANSGNSTIKMRFMRGVGSHGYVYVSANGNDLVHYRGPTSQSMYGGTITTDASLSAMAIGPNCK